MPKPELWRSGLDHAMRAHRRGLTTGFLVGVALGIGETLAYLYLTGRL